MIGSQAAKFGCLAAAQAANDDEVESESAWPAQAAATTGEGVITVWPNSLSSCLAEPALSRFI